MRKPSVSLSLLGLMLSPFIAEARTYTVGPVGRDYTQLYALFDANNLAPGDIVEVDGSSLYASVVVGEDDGGAPAIR